MVIILFYNRIFVITIRFYSQSLASREYMRTILSMESFSERVCRSAGHRHRSIDTFHTRQLKERPGGTPTWEIQNTHTHTQN